MVLEGATSGDSAFDSPSDDFTSQRYDDDEDGAASLERPLHIKANSLAVTWGVLGPLQPRHWEGERLRALEQRVLEEGAILNRPLRQSEVDALAEKTARTARVASYAPFASVALGLAQVLRHWTSVRLPGFRLPIFKNYNPDYFPGLKGLPARLVWRQVQFISWTTAWAIPNTLIFASMSASSDAVAILKDPRLEDYRMVLRQHLKEQQQQRRSPNQTQIPEQRSSAEGPWGTMDRQARGAATVWERRTEDAGKHQQTPDSNQDMPKRQPQQQPQPNGLPPWARARQQQRQQAESYDDASPTGGAFMDDFVQRPADGGLMSDSQMEMEDRKKDYASRVDERKSQNPPATPATVPAAKGQSRPARDDSPVAPGNAWERLRREAASEGSTSGGSQQQAGQQGSTAGDSFTFSQRDEDRQLAQAEAQSDFDARVERERRGEDFSGNKGGRRW